MKNVLAALAAGAPGLGISASGVRAQEAYILALNLTIPPTHNRWVKAIKPWVDELEKRSGGRIKVEPYCAGALSRQAGVMESVRTGMAQLGEAGYAVSIGNFLFHEQLLAVVTPSRYMLNTVDLIEAMEAAFPREAGRDWSGTRYLLTHSVDGGMFIGTRDKAVTSLADPEGMKIGVCGGGVRAERVRSLGATVVGIPTPDMYMSLEKGVIDGVLVDVDLLISRRIGEVVQHMTLLNNNGGACFYMAMNREAYDGLLDDRKQVVDELSGEYAKTLFRDFWRNSLESSARVWIDDMGGRFQVLPAADYAQADRLYEEVDRREWIGFLSDKGLPAAAMDAKFRELEAAYSIDITTSPLMAIGR